MFSLLHIKHSLTLYFYRQWGVHELISPRARPHLRELGFVAFVTACLLRLSPYSHDNHWLLISFQGTTGDEEPPKWPGCFPEEQAKMASALLIGFARLLAVFLLCRPVGLFFLPCFSVSVLHLPSQAIWEKENSTVDNFIRLRSEGHDRKTI